MSIVYTNNLDMHSGGVPLIVHIGQYDSDFSLVFNLYSSVGNFSIESGTTAEIRGTKSDGFGYSANATIDIANKRVTVAGSNQMTASARKNIFELVLLKNSKVLSSANFILDVEHAALDADTIQDESVLKELNAIIAGAETATQAAQDADAAADRAEAAADDLSGTVQQVATNTQDIADLKDDLSTDVNLYTGVPAVNDVLFTVSDAVEGEKINYSMILPPIGSSGYHTGYIGLYNASDTRLAYYGRGSSSDPTTAFSGSFEIPPDFSYAKWYGAVSPTSLNITKRRLSLNFVSYDTEQALTDAQKTIAQTNIGVEDFPDVYDFLKDELEHSSGEVQLSDYPRHVGWLNGDNKWNLWNNITAHCIIPVQVGEEIQISTNAGQGIYMAFFTSYTTPVDGQLAPIVSGWGRRYLSPNTDNTITVPAGTQYLFFGLDSGDGGEYQVKSLIIPSAATVTSFDQSVENVVYKDSVASVTLGTPVEILSNKDTGATSLDNGWLGFFNIIQMADDMYYMFYGGDTSVAPVTSHILFAYSTDGVHYTRGFPEGIEAPFPGTNIVFNDNVGSQSVVKCCDPVYPFRLICQQQEGNDYHMNMYKSVDGINWDLSTKRTLRWEYHDTQTCIICRGEVLKVYYRENVQRVVSGVSHHSREIGVTFYDLEGNLLSPRRDLDLQFVYNNAATPINDVEELIFPTYFDNTEVGGVASQDYYVSVYQVDKYHLTPVQSNLDNYFGTNDKFVLFSPGFITIAGEQYITYKTQNIYHDDWSSSDPATRKATYMLAKITLAF